LPHGSGPPPGVVAGRDGQDVETVAMLGPDRMKRRVTSADGKKILMFFNG
jgi:hypothetical protein